MKMKKFMAAAGLIFAAMLLSFGAQAEAAKPKVMKVGLVTARDTAQAKAFELFIKEVEQKSGGAIKGELFADAQLGGTPKQHYSGLCRRRGGLGSLCSQLQRT